MNLLIWHDSAKELSKLAIHVIHQLASSFDVKVMPTSDIESAPWEANCRIVVIDCGDSAIELSPRLSDRLNSWLLESGISQNHCWIFGSGFNNIRAKLNRKVVFLRDLKSLEQKISELGIFTTNGLNKSSETLYIFGASSNLGDWGLRRAQIDANLPIQFNNREYFGGLETRSIGRVILYADEIGSTQSFLMEHNELVNSLPHGTAMIASHQTAGKGRGANRWVSSKGVCLQTTFVLKSLPDNIALPLLQHLIALSAVQTARQMYNLRVSIKWPNDIYAHEGTGGLKKVGGLLIQSAGDNVLVGFGLNVKRSDHLYSLEQLAEDSELSAKLSIEAFAAGFFNRLESLLEQTAAHGFPFHDYYAAWLHSGQIVLVESAKIKARIQGIDQYGYLQALPIDSGLYGLLYPNANAREMISLHPDGNSFDMMQNLISVKMK